MSLEIHLGKMKIEEMMYYCGIEANEFGNGVFALFPRGKLTFEII